MAVTRTGGGLPDRTFPTQREAARPLLAYTMYSKYNHRGYSPGLVLILLYHMTPEYRSHSTSAKCLIVFSDGAYPCSRNRYSNRRPSVVMMEASQCCPLMNLISSNPLQATSKAEMNSSTNSRTLRTDASAASRQWIRLDARHWIVWRLR